VSTLSLQLFRAIQPKAMKAMKDMKAMKTAFIGQPYDLG
jgi:hypothetical protein